MRTFDIMWDWDDVIQPLAVRLHEKAHEMGLHDNTIEALEVWHGWLQYNVHQDKWFEVFDELMCEGWYHNGPLIPGVVDAMRRLKLLGHRNHLLTARGFMKHGELIKEATYEIIKKNDVPVDTITFDKDKVNGMITALGGWSPPDARPTFDFAIDDGPHNYEALDSAGVPVYLLEVPHNKAWREEHPDARVVPTVDAFVDLIIKESHA